MGNKSIPIWETPAKWRYGKSPDMGNNLKSIRESKGMTLDEAAEAMGVSRGQYIKLERGERRLTSDYILQAAKGFGVSTSTVFNADDEIILNSNPSGESEFLAYAGVTQAGVWRDVEIYSNSEPKAVAIQPDRHDPFADGDLCLAFHGGEAGMRAVGARSAVACAAVPGGTRPRALLRYTPASRTGPGYCSRYRSAAAALSRGFAVARPARDDDRRDRGEP